MSDASEQKGAIEIKDDEALQLIGRELLDEARASASESRRCTSLDNNVLIKPDRATLSTSSTGLIEHYGGCNFNNVGENYYVNTQPMKLDSVTFDVSNALMKILRRMAVNEIAIGGPIDGTRAAQLPRRLPEGVADERCGALPGRTVRRRSPCARCKPRAARATSRRTCGRRCCAATRSWRCRSTGPPAI